MTRREGARDPLDALGAAWSRLEVPAPADALEDADETTRAVVAWTRAAWRRVHEAPTQDALARFTTELERERDAATRRARFRRLTSGVSAALAVAAAVLLLLRAAPHLAPSVEPGTETRLASHDPIHPRFRPDGSVELRSGKVRLVLLPPEETE